MPVQEYDQETKDYEVARHAVFWSDDGSKSLYKNHIKCASRMQCRTMAAIVETSDDPYNAAVIVFITTCPNASFAM